MFFFCAEQKYCICQLLSATQYIVFLQLDDRIFCFLCQAKDKMDENRGCKHGKRGKTKEWLSPYVFMEEFCYIIIGKESLDGCSNFILGINVNLKKPGNTPFLAN